MEANRPLRVTLISKSDTVGGAAVVTTRLMHALRDSGVDARMLVAHKGSTDPHILQAAPALRIKRAFLADRLSILAHLHGHTRNLWKIDTAAYGLPLSRHPWVQQADVVCPGWINQGMLSLQEIGRILSMGKPIVWTMHDMWNMTGICHHAGECRGYEAECGECPLMGAAASPTDLSHRVHERKDRLYDMRGLTFVAVSRWLAAKARASSLLRGCDVRVIGNPFALDENRAHSVRRSIPADGTVTLIMGAARLDDPIKGHDILVATTRLLADDSRRYRLLTYGGLKDPHALDGVAIDHRHLGYLSTPEAVEAAYREADIVVSTSHYETLPGTLVEGQAYGSMPVAFDHGGQRDIITDGVTGFLAEYSTDTERAAASMANAIRKAADAVGPMASAQMHLSVMERFSARSVARKYIELFEEVKGRRV